MQTRPIKFATVFLLIFSWIIITQGHAQTTPTLTNHAAGKLVTFEPTLDLEYWGNAQWTIVDGTGQDPVALTQEQLAARLTDEVTFTYCKYPTGAEGDDDNEFAFLNDSVSWHTGNGTQNPRVAIVDLAEVQTDIVKVRADSPAFPSFGPKNCGGIDVYGSSDGVNFEFWGAAELANTPANGEYFDNEVGMWVWEGTARSARYVKFELSFSYVGVSGTESLFELFVYGDGSTTISNHAFGKPVSFDPVLDLNYWGNQYWTIIDGVGQDPVAITQEQLAARVTDEVTFTYCKYPTGHDGDDDNEFAFLNDSVSWHTGNGTQNPRVAIVDLEEVKDDIIKVRADSPAFPSFAPKNCGGIDVFGSSDGVNFEFWGAAELVNTPANGEYFDNEVGIWVWEGAARSARYVKFELSFSYVGVSGVESLFELFVYGGQSDIPEPTPVKTNYAKWKTVTATPPMPADYWLNDSNGEIKLTDGISSEQGNEWSMACGWNNTLDQDPVLVVDLEAVKDDIGEVRVDNLVNDSGSRLLVGAQVWGSIDGVEYTLWGEMTDQIGGTDLVMHPWVWKSNLNPGHQARYVKVVLDWDIANNSYLLYELYVYNKILEPNSVSPTFWTLF